MIGAPSDGRRRNILSKHPLFTIAALKSISYLLAGLPVALGFSLLSDWWLVRPTALLIGGLVWAGGEWLVNRADWEWRFSKAGIPGEGWSVAGLGARIIGLAGAAYILPITLLFSVDVRSSLEDLWPYSLLLRTLTALMICYLVTLAVKTFRNLSWSIAVIALVGLASAVVAFVFTFREFPIEWALSQSIVAAVIGGIIFVGELQLMRYYAHRIAS